MRPVELWDAFEDAYNISGAPLLDEESKEMGEKLTYGQMRNNIEATIKYWTDPTTNGGYVLYESNYIKALDPAILEMIQEYEKEIKRVKTEIIKRLFK